MQQRLRIVVTACLPWLAACPSVSLLHTATPVPVGETEFGVGVGAYGLVNDDSGSESDPLGLVEFQARGGLMKNLDGGLRLANIGMVQGDLNWAPLNWEHFAVSINPTVSFVFVAGITATYLWLPVLVDVIKTDRFTLTLSARIGHFYANDFDGGAFSLETPGGLTGFGAGLRIKLSDRLSLMPEFHVVESPVDDIRFYTLSLGFLF